MKVCDACGQPMRKRPNESAKNWDKRLTCSPSCANANRRARTGCNEPDCGGSHYARGWCRNHYSQRKVIREWPPLTWSPSGPVPCQTNPDLFIPPTERGYWDPKPAIRLCQGCPEINDCLIWAMTDERPAMGVYGGMRFHAGKPERERVTP